MLFARQKAAKSTRSVLPRKGHRRKAEKFFSILFVPNKKYGKSCRGAAKDLILLVRSWCLGGLLRGLENLEALFGKVLILLVRSRHCGELNRGLENLETPGKGVRIVTFCVVQKEPKSTPEVCEPLDSGDDSNLRLIQDFGENDRPSSCNRPRRKAQPFRISPVRI